MTRLILIFSNGLTILLIVHRCKTIAVASTGCGSGTRRHCAVSLTPIGHCDSVCVCVCRCVCALCPVAWVWEGEEVLCWWIGLGVGGVRKFCGGSEVWVGCGRVRKFCGGGSGWVWEGEEVLCWWVGLGVGG